MSKKLPREVQILSGYELIQAMELKRREGRYSVKEAIEILEDQTGERFPVAQAAWVGDLPYFMQGSLQKVTSKENSPEAWSDWPVFNDHTEVYWCDLNKWLVDTGSRVTYRFPNPSAAPVVAETTEQRRARYLALFDVEEKREHRGALQRVADSEGVDRSNMKKDIDKARAARDMQKKSGLWTSQLVQDGKRTD